MSMDIEKDFESIAVDVYKLKVSIYVKLFGDFNFASRLRKRRMIVMIE